MVNFCCFLLNAYGPTDALQIDRSGLREGFCRSNVRNFERQFQVSYSKLNCEFFANSGFQHDCSLSPYFGVFTGAEIFIETLI